MKKTLIFLFLFVFAFTFRSIGQKGLYVGFAGNVGISAIGNQNLYGMKWNYLNKDKSFDPAYKITMGYGANAKLGYNFTPPIGMQLEVGYQSRGQKYEDTDGRDVTHTKDISLNYITTGVYFRYTSIFRRNYYKKEQKVRLAITVGPQFNVLLSADQTYSLSGEVLNVLGLDLTDIDYPSSNPPAWTSDYNFSNDADDKALFRNYDIGLLARIGVDFYPKKWFFISPTITSYLSLTDINDKDFSVHSGYGQSRNFSMGFELGFGFYMNKE
ncbi:MAG: outer membrane beta-barrel protein [Bacteroidetes bacterium]|nr:outer membrane beta-barrel protein [Bacteroidota bacterium]